MMEIAYPGVESSAALPKSESRATTFTDTNIVIRNNDDVDHRIHVRLETGLDGTTERYDIAHESQQLISVPESTPMVIELYTDHDCAATISFESEYVNGSIPEFTIRSSTVVVTGDH